MYLGCHERLRCRGCPTNPWTSRSREELRASLAHYGFKQDLGAPYGKGIKIDPERRKRAMHKRKKGTLKSGRSGKTVKSKKQAIAIGLSEARAKGKKVPAKKAT